MRRHGVQLGRVAVVRQRRRGSGRVLAGATPSACTSAVASAATGRPTPRTALPGTARRRRRRPRPRRPSVRSPRTRPRSHVVVSATGDPSMLPLGGPVARRPDRRRRSGPVGRRRRSRAGRGRSTQTFVTSSRRPSGAARPRRASPTTRRRHPYEAGRRHPSPASAVATRAPVGELSAFVRRRPWGRPTITDGGPGTPASYVSGWTGDAGRSAARADIVHVLNGPSAPAPTLGTGHVPCGPYGRTSPASRRGDRRGPGPLRHLRVRGPRRSVPLRGLLHGADRCRVSPARCRGRTRPRSVDSWRASSPGIDGFDRAVARRRRQLELDRDDLLASGRRRRRRASRRQRQLPARPQRRPGGRGRRRGWRRLRRRLPRRARGAVPGGAQGWSGERRGPADDRGGPLGRWDRDAAGDRSRLERHLDRHPARTTGRDHHPGRRRRPDDPRVPVGPQCDPAGGPARGPRHPPRRGRRPGLHGCGRTDARSVRGARGTSAAGDYRITVHTTRASEWGFEVPADGCSGSLPTVFPDLVGNVHAAEIACLEAWGVTRGQGDLYGVADPVTRGQMASFLVNLLDALGVDRSRQPPTRSPMTTGPRTRRLSTRSPRSGIVTGRGRRRPVPGEAISADQRGLDARPGLRGLVGLDAGRRSR